MSKTPTKGRQRLFTLAIVAVAVIGMSGCMDASGLEVDGLDSASVGASNLQTTPDEPTEETPGGESRDGDTQSDGDGQDATGEASTDGTDDPPETTTSSQESDEGSDTTDATSSSSTSSGSSEDISSEGSDESSSEGSADTSAEEPELEPEGPQRGEVTSDESTHVLSHDIKDYPDGKASVGGSLENPTDESLDLVRVTVRLYDDSGSQIGEQTTSITDLEPGEGATYATTFEDVDYLDVDRYEVESAAVEAQEETTGTSTPTETATAAAAAASTETQDDATQDDATQDSQDLPEPEGPQRGEVTSDESTHVLSHDIKDYPDGKASVGGTLLNPTDQDLEHVHVTVRLYDEADAEIGSETVCILDVPAGEGDGYSVTFPEVDYLDVDRYEVETFVGDD